MSLDNERRRGALWMAIAKLNAGGYLVRMYESDYAERCPDFKLVVDQIHRDGRFWIADFRVESENDQLSRMVLTFRLDTITLHHKVGVLLNLIQPLQRSISHMNDYTLEALEIVENYIREDYSTQTSPLPAEDPSGTSNPLDLKVVGQEWLFGSWRVMITSQFSIGRLFIVEHGNVDENTYVTDYKTRRIKTIVPSRSIREGIYGRSKETPAFDYTQKFRKFEKDLEESLYVTELTQEKIELADAEEALRAYTASQLISRPEEQQTELVDGVELPDGSVTENQILEDYCAQAASYRLEAHQYVQTHNDEKTVEDLNARISKAMGHDEPLPLPEFLQGSADYSGSQNEPYTGTGE